MVGIVVLLFIQLENSFFSATTVVVVVVRGEVIPHASAPTHTTAADQHRARHSLYNVQRAQRPAPIHDRHACNAGSQGSFPVLTESCTTHDSAACTLAQDESFDARREPTVRYNCSE